MITYIYMYRFISSCYVVVLFFAQDAFHNRIRNDSSEQVSVCVPIYIYPHTWGTFVSLYMSVHSLVTDHLLVLSF